MNFKSMIRPERAVDRAAVLAVVEAAFGADEGPRVARLVTALHETGAARVSLVAEVGGRIVGHVQLNRSWVDAPKELVEVLVLSPLAVAPDHQGRGIGAALVEAAVAAAERAEAPAVFLEGDPAYYGRLGWRPAGPLGFTKPSVRIPDAAFQVVLTAAWAAPVTGALVYCDAFWALDCVGLRPDDG